MSTLERGSARPQAASAGATSSTSSSASRKAHTGFEKSWTQLLERWSDNMVLVGDHSRVLECSLVERQAGFQQVVRHYICQILYGCKATTCNTRTCLSCIKQLATHPVRPPTQLTARALAFYLASQDDAPSGLCHNTLKVAPESLEIDGALGAVVLQTHDGDPHLTVCPTVDDIWPSYGTVMTGDEIHSGIDPRSNGLLQNCVITEVLRNIDDQQQIKKDPKSISQNLYDSIALIYSYSKQIPSSASVFNTLFQLADSTINSLPKQHSEHVVTFDSNSHPPPMTSRAPPDPHLHINEDLNHISSLTQNKVSTSNGQQFYKIPYVRRRGGNLAVSRCLANSSLPGDGIKSLESARLHNSDRAPRSQGISITKTGKKNFTLGGSELPLKSTENRPAAMNGSDRVNPVAKEQKLAMSASLDGATLKALKNEVGQCQEEWKSDVFNFNVDFDSIHPFRPPSALVNRSLFFVLSHPETLLKSFYDKNSAFESSPLSHLDSTLLVDAFQDWDRQNGTLIFDSLWIALEALFTPPTIRQNPRLRFRYLSNFEAAHIVMVGIHALTSHIKVGSPHAWSQLRKLRSWGIVLPVIKSETISDIRNHLDLSDGFENEPAIRLADRLLGGVGARRCFEHIQSAQRLKNIQDGLPNQRRPEPTVIDLILQHLDTVEQAALARKRNGAVRDHMDSDPGWTVTSVLLEWLKTIIAKKWDGKAIIDKWSSVGTAIMLLDAIHDHHMGNQSLNVHPNMFEFKFLDDRLDAIEEPRRFMDWTEGPNHFHILQYPALFPTEYLVKYLRTIHFHSMMKHYDHTSRTKQLKQSMNKFVAESHRSLLKTRLKVTLSDYLLLNVSREDVLFDTLNKLWKLERRMLSKPLKVKLGKYEGEVGLDHGGVTYEFFRIVLSEAFQPDYALFTIDPQTRMTWFQPDSPEPNWKFEMIGMIFSLAVYNGVTLPVTFPLALYQFLLPHDAPLYGRPRLLGTEYIKDGWPDLARSFTQLLEWTDGDVGDTFMREYAFSYELFGSSIDRNMDESFSVCKDSLSEPELVTNTNREQFVVDYIHHLTYVSVKQQIEAFRKGFYACLDPKSLHLFSAVSLRNLVEGSQVISTRELRRITRYGGGYTDTHPTIEAFWRIADGFDQDDCRNLLQFVTASDRIPVVGYDSIIFQITSSGGLEKLPTSSTCFGKMYLPNYEDVELMKPKLELAIRHSEGFGNV